MKVVQHPNHWLIKPVLIALIVVAICNHSPFILILWATSSKFNLFNYVAIFSVKTYALSKMISPESFVVDVSFICLGLFGAVRENRIALLTFSLYETVFLVTQIILFPVLSAEDTDWLIMAVYHRLWILITVGTSYYFYYITRNLHANVTCDVIDL